MPKKINIALAGFGNIGSYFYKSIEKNKGAIAIKTGKRTQIISKLLYFIGKVASKCAIG